MKLIVVGNFARWLITFRGPLLRQMVRMGHEVIACAPDASPEIIRQLEGMGVRYEKIPVDRDGLSLTGEVALTVYLYRLFRKVRPDNVLCYTVKPVIYGSIAAKTAGVPGVFSLIEGLGHVFSGSGRKRAIIKGVVSTLYALAMRLNTCVFFINQHDRDFFIKRHILPTRTRRLLLNSIGLDGLEYPPAPLPENISFLFAARLIKEKGIADYVRAAEIVKNRHPETIFRVAGWIDENPSAISETQLARWKDSGNIVYMGNLENIRGAMAASSVFVLPTYYKEGVPRSILEAMSMGRPVITTDIPGCRTAVLDGVNGIRVEPRNPEMLAEAMMTLIGSPERVAEMGEKGRQLASVRFDSNHINQVILETMGIS